jgi:hypothetical protein
MAWNLTGQLIETCSCNMLCPCWFGVRELMIMDRGWCTTTLTFRIDSGRSDGVELSGRTVVHSVDFPGPTLFDGGGTARLWLDDRASAEQQRELEAIFRGDKGGPMAILTGLVKTWLPTQPARIEMHDNAGKLTITVTGAGTVESTLLRDEEGHVMTMQNVGFASAFKFDNLTGELAPSAVRWSDPAMPHQFEHRSGARGKFTWREG